MKIKLTDITPKAFQCGIGACPAIFETPEGNYVLVGKKLTYSDDLDDLKGRIGPDEIAIEIPRGLLSNIARQQ